jgi:hypothetical protein
MTISFPNNGGKDSTKRIATGINQPYLSCCSFLTKGVNQSMIYMLVQFSREVSYFPPIQIVTHRVVEESHQGHDNDNEHKGYIVPYPFFPDPKPPIAYF